MCHQIAYFLHFSTKLGTQLSSPPLFTAVSKSTVNFFLDFKFLWVLKFVKNKLKKQTYKVNGAHFFQSFLTARIKVRQGSMLNCILSTLTVILRPNNLVFSLQCAVCSIQFEVYSFQFALFSARWAKIQYSSFPDLFWIFLLGLANLN